MSQIKSTLLKTSLIGLSIISLNACSGFKAGSGSGTSSGTSVGPSPSPVPAPSPSPTPSPTPTPGPLPVPAPGPVGANCGMQLNDTPPVFCETFDQPSTVMNRSGQLNGNVWGVSRVLGGGPLWMDSTLEGCNGPQATSPSDHSDVIICNGQLRETTNDNHDVSVLAMYPKQPFDFSGRIGTVAFDVSNDTTGNHGAWPEFWITDKPVPAPLAHLFPCDTCTVPRHGLGIRFAAQQGECPGGFRADSAVVIRDFVVEDRGIFENNTSGMRISEKGCAALSSGPNGGLNHIEIRISQNQIDVYASDAGTKNLHLINSITNANLSFTRGLIWLEDAHYNAEKAFIQDPTYPSQRIHTYTWDNVAFDGPATYRDLSFDVLDSNIPLGNGLYKIGWDTTPSTPANLTSLPMTAAQIAGAASAILVFNFAKEMTPAIFNYTINGHVNTAANPQPNDNSLKNTRAMMLAVPLSQLVAGPQSISLSTDVTTSFSNVNIILVNAAPVPPIAMNRYESPTEIALEGILNFTNWILRNIGPSIASADDEEPSTTLKMRQSSIEFTATTNVGGLKIQGVTKKAEGSGEMSVQTERNSRNLASVSDNNINILKFIATIPVESLTTGIDLRDRHMREYIFKTKEGTVPPIIFKSSHVKCEKSPNVEKNCEVEGELSIRSVAKKVKLPMKMILNSDNRIKALGEKTILLSDFGIRVPGYMGIRDEVLIKIDVTGEISKKRVPSMLSQN